MPATDFQGPFGRSMIGTSHEPASQEAEMEAFQRQVADRFADLSTEDLLSVAWVRKLLDVFLCCQEDFRAILFVNKGYLQKSPTDRLLADFFERSVKALDVCNAIRDGIEQIRQWQKLVEIVVCALECNDTKRSLGEGQFRRAKKALIDLAIGMLDEKDSSTALSHRNRSFGRSKDTHHHRSIGHFRSLSWSVSRSWSAARQLQAIGNNLAVPRGNEVVATHGLAVPIYTMGSVLLFVMWALVAAIPCQDRGLQVHFSVPRQYSWSAPMMALHEKILEESKRRERKNACGLLKEIYQIERCSRMVSELVDSVQYPLTEEKEGEIRQRMQEFELVYEAIKEGLNPLERQVREVFHRIVRSRTDGLDSLGRVNTE